MLSLRGRGAIVSGTRRVGAVVARRLAAEGVELAILYRNSRREAEDLLAQVREDAPRSLLVQCDLADEPSLKRAVLTAREVLGDLSFCVNMASDYPRTPLDSLDGAAWDRAMASSRGAYLLALHASRLMRDNPGPTRGQLIFFGDWAAGETPYVDYLPYLTAKAAVHFMVRCFAVELAPFGILVNAVSPGPTMLPADMSRQEWSRVMAETPLHRESSAEEMAEMVVTLLRLETMTGENVRIDAGRHVAGNLGAEILS